MEVHNAVALINTGITFFPGWVITAYDYTARHENAIQVRTDYTVKNYRQANAPDYVEDVHTHAEFIIDASECDDFLTLYRKVLDGLLTIVTHEAREAFRIAPTWWGPFNPHMSDGQRNWGDRKGDWAFGLV
jgi:hypothetical protein